jgi:hypothetical protein
MQRKCKKKPQFDVQRETSENLGFQGLGEFSRCLKKMKK